MDSRQYPVSIDLGVPESAPAPEPPPSGPWVWMRENLFSTPFNSVLSIVTLVGILAVTHGIIGWALGDRIWRAVAANARLLMVQAYPTEHFWRVWVSVGVIVVLAALSLAYWRVGSKLAWRELSRVLVGIGVGLALVSASAIWHILGHGETPRLTIVSLVVGVVLAVGAHRYAASLGEEAKEPRVSTITLLGLALVILIAFIWVMQAPVPGVNEEGFNADVWEPIALSTKVPWTILAVLGVVTYWVGLGLREAMPGMRRVLIALWVLSTPFIYMVLFRGPDIDWLEVLTLDTPVFLGFTILGGLFLRWAADPKSGELGRFLAGAIFVLGLLSLPFIDTLMLFKVSVLGLGTFALLAPTFAGSPAARRQFLVAWAGAMLLIVIIFRMGDSASALGFRGSTFLGGLALTFALAIFGIALSFPLGVILALGRTSTMPILRTVCTFYIELVRSVPLITWLFASANLFQLFIPGGLEVDNVVRAIGAITLFSAAYLAENVRGGLQSISRGQYEAADALGMTIVQKTSFIILPQALKAVIPALVGQVIALFKDTSLVAIIGLFDLLLIAKNVIPNQSQFLGSFMEAIVAVAVIYWIFTFAFSRASIRLEKRLGLGTR